MAVIKESRQFKIGPVGVARASDTRQTSRALSEALSTVGKIQYERAARNALKVGEEAGESAIVIDPETGLPKPLIPPKGFGSIATDAYDKVARNRFEFSIQKEIQLKGQEFAAKYANDPNGSTLYHQNMSNYIESMTEAAEGAGYKSYIADTGTAYRDLTTQDLAIKEQERERARTIAFVDEAFIDGTNAAKGLWATNPIEAQILSDQSVQGVIDAVGAGLKPKSAIKEAKRIVDIKKGQGLLMGLGPEVSTDDIRSIIVAFKTGKADLIPTKYEYLKSIITDFKTDYDSIAELGNFAQSQLQPISVLSATREAEAEARRARRKKANLYREIDDFYSDTVVNQDEIINSFNTDSEVSTEAVVLSSLNAVKALRREALFAGVGYNDTIGSPEERNLKNEQAVNLLASTAQAILAGNRNSNNPLRSEEISRVIEYLKANKGDGSRVPTTGMSPATLNMVALLEKVIDPKVDNTSQIKTSVLNSLENTLKLGDAATSKTIEFTPAEAASWEAQAGISGPRVMEDLQDFLNKNVEKAKEFAANQMFDSAAKLQIENEEAIVAVVDGLIARSVLGLGTQQTEALMEALQLAETSKPEGIAGAISKAPNRSSKEVIQFLKTLQSSYPKKGKGDIWSKAMAKAKQWNSGGAKNRDLMLDEMNKRHAIGANNTLNRIDINNIDYSLDPIGVHNSVVEQINSIGPSLSKELSEKAKDASRLKVAKSFIDKLLNSQGLEEEQLNVVIDYYNETDSANVPLDDSGNELFSPQQKTLLNTIRDLAKGNFNQNSFEASLKTQFSAAVSTSQKQLSEIRAQEAIVQKIQDLRSGNLLNNKDNQEFLEDQLRQSGIDLSSAIHTEGFYSSIEGQSVLTEIVRGGVLPTSIVSAFRNLSDGNFSTIPGFNPSAVLSLFQNLSTHQYLGQTFDSKTMDALSDEQKGSLIILRDAVQTMGSSQETIAQVLDLKSRFEDVEYVTKVNSFLGLEEKEKFIDFLNTVEGYNEIPAFAQNSLRVTAQSMVKTSMALSGSVSPNEIVKILEQEINNKYPSEAYFGLKNSNNPEHFIVRLLNGNGRTGANLSLTVPRHEETFKTFVTDKIVKSLANTDGPLKEVKLGPRQGKILFTEIGLDFEGTYFLQPTGPAKNGVTQYGVFEGLSITEGGYRQVIETISRINEFGDQEVFETPMFVSTADRVFNKMKEDLQNQTEASNLEIAKKKLAESENEMTFLDGFRKFISMGAN